MQGRVPNDADAGQFLKEVTRIANEEKLAIRNFQPEKPAEQDRLCGDGSDAQGQGSFASICRFFDRLTKLSRLSKVKALTVTRDGRCRRIPDDGHLDHLLRHPARRTARPRRCAVAERKGSCRNGSD